MVVEYEDEIPFYTCSQASVRHATRKKFVVAALIAAAEVFKLW
jgi:hypothetical protein